MISDKLLSGQKDREYVYHMTLGAGIVEKKKSMGFRLQVHFPDGIVRKLRSDEVTYITKEEYDRSVTGMESRTPAGTGPAAAALKPPSVGQNGVGGRQYAETKRGPSKEKTVPAYAATGPPGEPATSVKIGKGTSCREGSERKKQELSEASAGPHVQTGTIRPADTMKDRPSRTRSFPNITERDYRRSTKEFQARQVIESLRLGIPPQGVSEDFFEVFTVGRGDEIRRVEEFLEEDSEGSIIITGEYGSGKTHMMEITASIALREGWAVSMVELDTAEAPLSKPKSVYEKIAGSLRYMKDGRVQDFRNMLNDAAFSERYESIMDHEYLKMIIGLIRDQEVTESHYVWIEGSGNRKYPFFDVYKKNDIDMDFALKLPQVKVIQSCGNIMVKGQTDEIADKLRKLGFLELGPKTDGSIWILFDQDTERDYEDRNFPPMHHEMTSASIYCNILNGIGYMATELLGLKGLLILFDEAESVDRGYYTKHAADMGINFIRGLSSVCSNDPDLLKESNDVHKNVGREGIGKRTGLRYSRQKPLGFVYTLPSCVKTIYCFTPVEDILRMDPFSRMGRIDLTPIGSRHSREIFDNLSQYYALAYDFDTNGRVSGDDQIVRGAFNGGLRMGIKGAVEIFDRVRLKNDDQSIA